jgi:hypothetical protein
MTEAERSNTMRVVAKRNKMRLERLQREEDEKEKALQSLAESKLKLKRTNHENIT